MNFLQEELSTTLSGLEDKMAALDADLAQRAAEAEKLQVLNGACFCSIHQGQRSDDRAGLVGSQQGLNQQL